MSRSIKTFLLSGTFFIERTKFQKCPSKELAKKSISTTWNISMAKVSVLARALPVSDTAANQFYSILVHYCQKWSIMVHFGPKLSILVYVGPFWFTRVC